MVERIVDISFFIFTYILINIKYDLFLLLLDLFLQTQWVQMFWCFAEVTLGAHYWLHLWVKNKLLMNLSFQWAISPILMAGYWPSWWTCVFEYPTSFKSSMAIGSFSDLQVYTNTWSYHSLRWGFPGYENNQYIFMERDIDYNSLFGLYGSFFLSDQIIFGLGDF